MADTYLAGGLFVSLLPSALCSVEAKRLIVYKTGVSTGKLKFLSTQVELVAGASLSSSCGLSQSCYCMQIPCVYPDRILAFFTSHSGKRSMTPGVSYGSETLAQDIVCIVKYDDNFAKILQVQMSLVCANSLTHHYNMVCADLSKHLHAS